VLSSAKNELEQRVREGMEELALKTAQIRALAGEVTLAEQRERARLAKVLHDHIQQLLVAAKFQVAVLGREGSDRVRKTASKLDMLMDSVAPLFT
jgi:signal transduction histidine kinase